jgi:Ricin-type beta-trefoil lectin domain
VLAAASVAVAARPAQAVPATGVPLRVQHSGKCLSVQGSSTADGAAVVQFGCQNLVAQRFRAVPQVTGDYQLVADHSGKCLNVEGNSTADMARVIQWPCSGTANERWLPRPVPGSTRVQLVSERSGKCLDVTFAALTDNAQVIQLTCGSTTSQQWYAPPATAAPPTAAVESYSRTAVMQASTGALEYAYVDNIGRLVEGRQTSPDVFTVQWTTLSGDLAYAGAPVLGELADGRVEVAAQQTDSDTWTATRTSRDGPAWGAPTDVGGAAVSHAVLGRRGNGTVVLFALDPGGGLWQLQQEGPVPFLSWRGLGASGLAGTPAVVPYLDGLQIVGLTAGGAARTAFYRSDGTLGGWTDLGGSGLSGTPALVVSPGPRLSVFLRSGDGTVVTKKQDGAGGWPATWTPLPGLAAAGSPAAVLSPSTGTVEVVARGADSTVYSTGETAQGSATWRPWLAVGPGAATDPTAVPYTGAAGPGWLLVYRTASQELRVFTGPATT